MSKQKRFYSTREVSKKLRLDRSTLNAWFKDKSCPKPSLALYGGYRIRLWSAMDIRKLRAYAARRYGKRWWTGTSKFISGRAKAR